MDRDQEAVPTLTTLHSSSPLDQGRRILGAESRLTAMQQDGNPARSRSQRRRLWLLQPSAHQPWVSCLPPCGRENHHAAAVIRCSQYSDGSPPCLLPSCSWTAPSAFRCCQGTGIKSRQGTQLQPTGITQLRRAEIRPGDNWALEGGDASRHPGTLELRSCPQVQPCSSSPSWMNYLSLQQEKPRMSLWAARGG